MVKKKVMKKKTPAPSEVKDAQPEDLKLIAKKLLFAEGKNPYFLYHKAIRNFQDLANSIGTFPYEHVHWLAEWIEYLGDPKTAQNIREDPSRFKEIVTERFNELKQVV